MSCHGDATQSASGMLSTVNVSETDYNLITFSLSMYTNVWGTVDRIQPRLMHSEVVLCRCGLVDGLSVVSGERYNSLTAYSVAEASLVGHFIILI